MGKAMVYCQTCGKSGRVFPDRRSARGEFFDGQIQEVRLWRRALDPAEVRGLTK